MDELSANKMSVTTLGDAHLIEFALQQHEGALTELVSLKVSIPLAPSQTLQQIKQAAAKRAIDLLQTLLKN